MPAKWFFVVCLSRVSTSVTSMQLLLYWIALLGVKSIRALPLAACFLLGQSIGLILWAILPGYRSLARRNLTSAFPEKSAGEIARLARRHFIHLGANGLCALKMAEMPYEKVRQHCEVVNIEAIHRTLASGRGVVAAISHIGNWELIAQLGELVRPTRIGTVFQAIHNPHIDRLINGARQRRGTLTFDRKKGYAGAIALLREPGIVGVLVDQHAGNSGIWMPFFNRMASTSPLAAALAARTGAAVIPLAITTEGFARWKLEIMDPVEATDDQDEMTWRINLALESQIRSSPPDWFWVHNRWKTPQPKFLISGAKRGIYVPPGIDPRTLRPFRVLLRSSNWLGDAAMSIPAARAIKAGRPDLHLSVLVPEKLADLWRSVAEVDEVIPFAKGEGVRAVARRLRGRFDAAILFPNSLRSALEVWLAGIPRRAGYPGHRRRWLMDQIEPEKKRTKSPPGHQAERYLRLAERLGADISGPIAPPPPRAIAQATHHTLGVCPGAEYGPAKRWPAERFRAVMAEVSRRRACSWVIVGTAKDSPIAAEILAGFPGDATDLTGKTSLSELIGEITTFRALLTNDTGTMHLAAHLSVPTVAIFGSTEPRLTGPLGDFHRVIRHQVECSPCFLRDCPIDFRCMESVTVAEVVEAVLSVIDGTSG